LSSAPEPIVLAGPILRRIDSTSVKIFIAMKVRADLFVELKTPPAKPREKWVALECMQGTKWLSIGPNFHAALITVSLKGPARWPPRVAYEILARGAGDAVRSALERRQAALRLKPGDRLHFRFNPDVARPVWYASCRKMSGLGDDAALGMATRLKNISEEADWPSFLFLGGDQIYADEVSDTEILAVDRVTNSLFGQPKRKKPRIEEVRAIQLTTEVGTNHLLSLPDFLAYYCLAWSSQSYGHFSGKQADDKILAGITALETVFAHVPTYMIFDDHDVTDDWNLNAKWKKIADTTAREFIARAVGAYFVMQHWGNVSEPNVPKPEAVQKHLDEISAGAASEEPWQAPFTWSYAIPSSLPTLALDCRTARATDSAITWLAEVERNDLPGRSAFGRDQWLLSSRERLKAAASLVSGGHAEDLVLFVGTPLLTYWFADFVQGATENTPFSGTFDPEGWDTYAGSWIALIDELLKPLGVQRLRLIAGDVHYSFLAEGALQDAKGWSCKFVQVTSSPCKNKNSFPVELILEKSALLYGKDRSYLRAAWLISSRFLTSTFAWPDNDVTRKAVELRSKLNRTSPYLKTWKITAVGANSVRPVDTNSFSALHLEANTRVYAFSASASPLLEFSSSALR
jgi:PhoD-like phosphatase